MHSDSSRPAVSVVIPAYNAASYIEETLDSVLAQTYRDFETIVIDDGSTDNTGEVISQYGDAVRYIRKENGGSASARNRGIREARGRYIAFLDADDLWIPEKLERLHELFEKDPALAWAYSDALFVEAETDKALYRASQIRARPQGDVLQPLMLGNFMPPSMIVVKRNVLEEVGGFDESELRRISEDWELCMRIAARYPIRYLDEPLVHIRKHSENKTGTMNLEHALQSRLTTIKEAVARSPDRLTAYYDDAVANLYTNIGRKWLEREERAQARRLFWQALRHTPANVQAWIYGLATLLPRPVLRMLGRLRQIFRGRRRGERANVHVKKGPGSVSCV